MSRRFSFLLIVSLVIAAALAACNPRALTPTTASPATLAPSATPAPSPVLESTVAPPLAAAGGAYIEAADVSLLLPDGWTVTERTGPALPKQDAWAMAYGLCPATEPDCSSFLVVADAEAISSQEALRRLCSGGCTGSPAPQPVVLASGVELARYAFPDVTAADGAGGLAHEWFVTVHDGKLLVLSIVDAQTGATRDDILGTLAYGGEPYTGAVVVDALQAARRLVADPTGGLVAGWETVEVAEVDMMTVVPVGWRQDGDGYTWASPANDALRLGIAWQPRGAGREPTALLPADGVVLAEAMVELIWGDATIYTVQVTPQDDAPASLQEHIIVLTGDRVYDFSASAPDPEAMNGLREALFHVLRSAWFAA